MTVIVKVEDRRSRSGLEGAVRVRVRTHEEG